MVFKQIRVYYVLRLKNTDKYFEVENTGHLEPLERFFSELPNCTIFTEHLAAVEYIEFLEQISGQALKDKVEILKIEKTEIFKTIFTWF